MLQTTDSHTKSLVRCFQPNSQAKLRLFCFPYAGGSSHFVRSWSDDLLADIEICAVELPGRGSRFMEPLFTQMQALVEAIAPSLLPHLDKPFAFFGHSMGAILTFELARFLRNKYRLNPVHLFVSGHRAPQIPASDATIHALPEREFIKKLSKFNGIPEAVLANAELMQLLLPILRADFKVIETYSYTDEPRLNCPITAFGGLQDYIVSLNALEAWRYQTDSYFSLQMLPGDHFFIQSSQPMLLSYLYRELQQLLKPIIC